MALAVIASRAVDGMQAPAVQVEVHLANGLPSFTLVGLAETEVKEARERVRSALSHSGLGFPFNKRITVNLAPADLPKESGRFDLPIALGILAANGELDPARLEGLEFAGELSLAGELRPVRGALALGPCGAAARAAPAPWCCRWKAPPRQPWCATPTCAVPCTCWTWCSPALRNRSQGPAHRLAKAAPRATAARDLGAPDMRDVRGQAAAKQALEIAAAGGHSLLMSGPPGSGKSMLAQRLIGILPPMDDDEALASAAVASLSPEGFVAARWKQRPLRTPHHSASAVALVGGGSPPRPGEISLAHGGVLFLDELPEFPRAVRWRHCANRWNQAASPSPALHATPPFRRASSSSPP